MIFSQRGGGQVEEPGADHAAVPPDFGDPVQIQIEILLGLQDFEALRVSLHKSILNAIVHHLHQVTSAIRSNMPPTLIRSRGQGLEDGTQPLHDLLLAADHHAITLGQTPDATASAHVHKVQPPLLEHGRAAHRVLVVAIAAVNHGVARREDVN